eukprot:3278109-Alexandrium_andersonii.AAC.1
MADQPDGQERTHFAEAHPGPLAAASQRAPPCGRRCFHAVTSAKRRPPKTPGRRAPARRKATIG